jgi:mannose-6-phosphate isomerase
MRRAPFERTGQVTATPSPAEPAILKLAPLLKPAIWGGRRLATALGRALPDGAGFGESWEIVDLAGEQSIVADGPLAGISLGELRDRRAAWLLGAAAPLDGRFPLVLKFIDARDTLSVQVHPGPAACARIGGGARPKTESWFVIAAEPGAALYLGLTAGTDRGAFAAALAAGEVARLLHRVDVRGGELFHVPSGTVHAIGAGILLAEVQQSSDTTYRVFDWNRPGADGRPRPLHIEAALASIDFSRAGVPAFAPPRSGRRGVSCPDYVLEMIPGAELASGCALSSEGPIAVMGALGGGVAEAWAGGAARRLVLGETLLVPAAAARRVDLGGDGALSVLAALPAGPR